jgi:hypothetical protein
VNFEYRRSALAEHPHSPLLAGTEVAIHSLNSSPAASVASCHATSSSGNSSPSVAGFDRVLKKYFGMLADLANPIMANDESGIALRAVSDTAEKYLAADATAAAPPATE